MNPAIRLLYAEDNPQDADLTRAHFADQAPDFDLQIVTTGAACLEQIQRSPPDLLLLDHHLPDADGVGMLKALFRRAPGLPVVMVTGAGDEELVLRALRLGAANYLPKRGNYLESLPGLLRDILAERGRKQGQGLPGATAIRRVLYVEHLPMDVDLTLQHFAEHAPHLVLETVSTCAEAMARLARPPAYDLALVDLRMPDQGGLDFVREAKLRLARLPPFIMISGSGDEETAIATLKLGAADYVVKHEGYLGQLPVRIDLAIATGELARNNEDLRTELALRKQAEEALRRSEAKFRAVADHTYDWEKWDDPGGAVLYCSPSCERITGHAPGAFEADPGLLQRLIHPEDLARWHAHYAIVHAESTTPGDGPVEEVDFRIIRPDGEVRWVGHLCHLIRDAEGVLLGHRISNRDITERKQAEQALVAVQGQLALASRLAALGTLVSGVAHEINNPLAAALSDQDLALGVVKELRDRLRGGGPIDPEEEARQLDAVVEELGEAQEAGRRIERIVKDLKVFGRPSPSNARERIRLIDVVDLAMRWLPVTVDRTATVTVENGGAPDVVANTGQLTQVVVNLVTNAASATPAGSRGSVVIRVMPGTPGMARLEVVDHGDGIAPEILGRIFEPFFTTRDTGKGTGLGLSICHAIVAAHGGRLTVTSEVGRGSTFRVELPTANEDTNQRREG